MSTLFVRLPNHVGDACMCLPALELLAADGQALVLAGRAWAGDLFAGHGWPTIALPAGLLDQARVLRTARAGRVGAVRGVLFTNSLSSAAVFAAAGLRATGYARDGRSPLLARAVPVPAAWRTSMHMVEYYHALACTISGVHPPVPERLLLALAESARHGARTMLAAAGIDRPYVMLCPVATGRHRGRVKAWSGFGRLCARLQSEGQTVVACPGPGEHDAVRAAVPSASLLPTTDLGTFAALLAASRLVVANDSGPGHIAAAVGAPLISVFGVTEPTRTRPWGPTVRLVGSGAGWPDDAEVFAAVQDACSPAARARGDG
jgi:heptosyltransferase-2